jgi:RNA polymerase sigma-70 factor (ECF subfamily)
MRRIVQDRAAPTGGTSDDRAIRSAETNGTAGPRPTDAELVRAARMGSEEAWAQLVGRYHPALVRYLTRQTGDPELAANLAQDAFLGALVDLDQATAERAFAAWLYRIAQNRLRADRRRQRLRRFLSIEWLRERGAPIEAWTPAVEVVEDFSNSVGERDLVARVLGKLSPTLRDALLLHHLEGFTAREVATILDISIPAAERRITRAQAQFRARYNALTHMGEGLGAGRA